jgi:hypothetical protein
VIEPRTGRRFPPPAEILQRMQDPGPVEDLVPEGMVERPGAYGSTRCELEVYRRGPELAAPQTWTFDELVLRAMQDEDGIEFEGRSPFHVHTIRLHRPVMPPGNDPVLVRWRSPGADWEECGAESVWTAVEPRRGGL